ncbi:hypothetical protein H1D32_02630 [Anaerobacillus sp. CMMVII]|uniref:hypothetical protein n=1 Tax=Anaerobacillus sp. CMMVII TaxID=2755588 RepID=UPI0021B7F276|nr:hypothetical protein [Anaerobacillus sp. CMMVII]MCT8136744.1 hypothetical protein [Anaerobacillus sp. CMMVII]
MKKGIVSFLVISFLALLVACGATEEVQNAPINNSETKNTESNEQGSNNTGVITEDLSATLTETTSDKDKKHLFMKLEIIQRKISKFPSVRTVDLVISFEMRKVMK